MLQQNEGIYPEMKAACVVAVLGCVGLGACYESPKVTIHVPGKFKGATDPMLISQRSCDQHEALRRRFKQVQTDR